MDKNTSRTNPLPNTTLLAKTAYCITQTIGRCTGTTILAFAITTLVNQGFDWSTFSYYPNPVSDLLNLSNSQDIVSIELFNTVGQQLLSKEIIASNAQIEMSNYTSGAYFVQVTTGNSMETLRVIKK